MDPFSEPMDFGDAPPAAVPIKYLGKRYVLREPGAGIVLAWRKAVMESCVRTPSGDMLPTERTPETELKLIIPCLFAVADDGKETPVGEATIKAWPAPVHKAIFDRAKHLCGQHEDVDTLAGLEHRIAELQKRVEALKAAGMTQEERQGPKG